MHTVFCRCLHLNVLTLYGWRIQSVSLQKCFSFFGGFLHFHNEEKNQVKLQLLCEERQNQWWQHYSVRSAVTCDFFCILGQICTTGLRIQWNAWSGHAWQTFEKKRMACTAMIWSIECALCGSQPLSPNGGSFDPLYQTMCNVHDVGLLCESRCGNVSIRAFQINCCPVTHARSASSGNWKKTDFTLSIGIVNTNPVLQHLPGISVINHSSWKK